MLKIIGGKYRSRIIATPSIETVPTKNIVREALFSAVSFDLDGNTLDLFAGSGAIGIEALSRGAKKSYFVDKSISACKVIESNLKLLKEPNGVVLNMDYMDALKKLNEENVSFSFIYIDPPYKEKEFYQESLNYISSSCLLSSGGRVVLEYEGELNLDFKGFVDIKQKRYGYSKLILLRKEK